MFEKTERGDANRRTLAPLEQAPRDTSPGADCELLRLCDEFRRAHARWVEYFNSLADNMVDQEPAMGELARLRSVWRKALDRLREMPPATPSGALAKQDLACMLKAWSGYDDVFEFLALTSGEIYEVLCSSELRPSHRTRGRLNGSNADTAATSFRQPVRYRFGASLYTQPGYFQSVDRQRYHAAVSELSAGQLWPSGPIIRLHQRMTGTVRATN